ncbi:shikimate dehydrogenase [Bifidobacterium sp. BRDM6]|uniref:Shikimate dehydrogenase n=2 Tax=Bifidobacterium choloepi TaxID=2614131 RepID=A0A6I5N5U7_9BIFI|nr:shikimate dehydrogenase [Bifidobacterium choloepi]
MVDDRREQGRRAAVLGHPIAHSLSPVLHNAAYRALGLDDWTYGRDDVDENGLAGFLASLDPQWAGLSLTMPLKKTIQPYGEPASRWAKELGVANTVVFDWNGTSPAGSDLPAMKLYNTDVYGIARAFAEHGLDHAESAVILGNGNTATSALAAFAMMNGMAGSDESFANVCIKRLTVGARHPDRNPELAALAKRLGFDGFRVVTLDDVVDPLLEADVVVSTIPGTGADSVADSLVVRQLDRLAGENANVEISGTLLDVVYDPRPTRLMKAWERLGGRAIGGQWMLLYQAVAQVELMTGDDPDFDCDRCGKVDGDVARTARQAALEAAMTTALEEAL